MSHAHTQDKRAAIPNNRGGYAYDLAVAYRIYPKISKTPLFFADDKYLLAALCLRSFKEALGTLKVKVFALLDNCPKEYEELFRQNFHEPDLEVTHLGGVGNAATFGLQFQILSEQPDAEYVYFAEDDYFYLPNQFEEFIKFMQSNRDVQFISPYDHPDNYRLKLHQYSKDIRVWDNRYWRTAASTCLTFLTRKEALIKTRDVFATFAHRNFDCSIWLSLTKTALFHPMLYIRYFFGDFVIFKYLAKAWFFSSRQILFGPTYKIWIPIPSKSTHMDSDCISPGCDWRKVIGEKAKEWDHNYSIRDPKKENRITTTTTTEKSENVSSREARG